MSDQKTQMETTAAQSSVAEETTTVQALAEEAASWFEAAKRADESEYIRLRDGAPAWITDAVHEAHGDLLPDDWRYRWANDAFEAIAEEDDPDEGAYPFADEAVSVYTGDRLAWLASHLSRPGYVDEAMREFGGPSENNGIVGAIGLGQYTEALEVYGSVLASLRARAAEQVSS